MQLVICMSSLVLHLTHKCTVTAFDEQNALFSHLFCPWSACHPTRVLCPPAVSSSFSWRRGATPALSSSFFVLHIPVATRCPLVEKLSSSAVSRQNHASYHRIYVGMLAQRLGALLQLVTQCPTTRRTFPAKGMLARRLCALLRLMDAVPDDSAYFTHQNALICTCIFEFL